MLRWYDVRIGSQVLTVNALDAQTAMVVAASVARKPVQDAHVTRVQVGIWMPESK